MRETNESRFWLEQQNGKQFASIKLGKIMGRAGLSGKAGNSGLDGSSLRCPLDLPVEMQEWQLTQESAVPERSGSHC